jgi:hypothetical protein
MRSKPLFNSLCLGIILTLGNQSAYAAETPQAIKTFYANFSVPTPAPNAELIAASTTEDWKSCSAQDKCRGREESSKAFSGFAKAIPDMRHEIKDIVVTADRIVVRGQLSGTPAGDFSACPIQAAPSRS